MPDNKELFETVREYELSVRNENNTLHLSIPITTTLARAETFAETIGRRHAEKQQPGDTVTVRISRYIDGRPCAVWSERFPDPATRQITKINEAYHQDSEKEPNAQKAPSPHHS